MGFKAFNEFLPSANPIVKSAQDKENSWQCVLPKVTFPAHRCLWFKRANDQRDNTHAALRDLRYFSAR